MPQRKDPSREAGGEIVPAESVARGAKGRARKASKPEAKRATVHPFPAREPQPPFPEQKQAPPGIESQMRPRPRYAAPEYRAAEKLRDRAALVTGGDSGIGRAVAYLYAREGARLALVYLPQEQSDAEEIRDRIQELEGYRGGPVLLLPGDVSDPAFCRSAAAQTVRAFGRLDILVNNAAFQRHQEAIEDLSYEQRDRTFKTNIYGYFCMAKAALEHLPEGGNTGSITGLEGSRQLLDYASTKGAIHAFTKSLAQHLAGRKIRVNCVAPGPVWTPLQPADKEPQAVAHHGEETPMRRPAQPEAIAPSYVFLASEADSIYITGEVLTGSE